MRIALIPSRTLLVALLVVAALLLASLIAGADVIAMMWLAAASLIALAIITGVDYVLSRRAWRNANPQLARVLPTAFAIAQSRIITLQLRNQSNRNFKITLYDHADATLTMQPKVLTTTLLSHAITELQYSVIPTKRGIVHFAATDIRVLSNWRLCELLERAGDAQTRRVFPDYAQIARYAWLATDRRLAEIGIKTYHRRGEGTDFKQLSEYRIGDSVRHIDWKASLRHDKPIVREFQDERDQSVLLLLDCGRRMRAHDHETLGSSHFDQVLNAAMLLSYVALNQGDAVGAMTFGTPPDQARWFAPRKGATTLNALMSQLYSVQATPTHSDFVSAAHDVMLRQRKRSLVIIVSNFRDEDSSGLSQALKLLRSKHIVLTASLRERIVRELIEQPLNTTDAVIEIASAHLYEQQRRDAFNRLAAKDALMVDAEPERLGIELVNRYHAIKKAGLI
jgi:uncharacterized protein (DUF58 family)